MKINTQMKVLSIVLIGTAFALTLVGCGKTETKKPKEKEEVAESVVDFKKAALLNVEMGQTYLAQGQVNRAKQKFIHALELKPKLPEAHSSIGFFYESAGDIAEAEKHYKQAISYAESSKALFYNNYGTFLCRQKRFQEADKAFNQGLADKQFIETALIYENAGLCALEQQNVTKAYTYLEAAVKHDPSRHIAVLELAKLEMQKNNYLASKEFLDRFKSLRQPTAKSLLIEIQVNKQLGNLNEMASAALKLKNMYPQSAEYKQYFESNIHG